MQLPAIRVAVGLLLLAHATFGCGWCHVAHDLTQGAMVPGEDACCDSHKAPCLPGHHDPASPCPAQMACQVRCIYLPTESVRLDDPLQILGLADALSADPIVVEETIASRVALNRSDGPSEPGSLPRHLVFQLLLI